MDDFSFPAIDAEQDSSSQLPFPHLATFPAWFTQEKKTLRRKSFETAIESLEDELNSPRLSDDGKNEGSLEKNQEKMDMLWEDFNEELARISFHKRDETPTIGSEFDKRRRDSMMELCRIHVLEMTKNSSVIRRKRTTLLVMLKLLKRLFLIQKSHSSRKT